MSVDVIMPQMGESIFEGTITRWLKKPGDRVERDEPLFEISTDKVDAEIPAPSAGVLKEIKVAEGRPEPLRLFQLLSRRQHPRRLLRRKR
jgi:pyruvate dehydrogenase E2 component (dihydrolipoamide acetyltransferase)